MYLHGKTRYYINGKNWLNYRLLRLFIHDGVPFFTFEKKMTRIIHRKCGARLFLSRTKRIQSPDEIQNVYDRSMARTFLPTSNLGLA